MSENVEIVQRDIAARDARDWTSLTEIWHPDIELSLVRGGGTYRGIDQIRDFFDILSGLHAECRVEAVELLDAGERVVTVERISGRGLKGSDPIAGSGRSSFASSASRKGGYDG